MYSPLDSSAAADKRALLAEERYLGRKIDIVHWFYSWNKTFPSWREPYQIANGRVPMISWAEQAPGPSSMAARTD